MFQLWRNHMLIVIEPAGLTLKQDQQLVQSIANNSTAKDLKKIGQSLLDLLQENAAYFENTQLDIVLSNHFVRFNILEWRNDVVRAADWQALAKAQLAAVYGKVVDNWQINIDSQGYANPSVVCAIDKGFLQQLESIAEQAGCQLNSVTPAFSHIASKFDKRVGEGDILLVSEPGRIIVGIKQAGCWQQVDVSVPMKDKQNQEADKMLRRLLASLPKRPKVIHLFGIVKQHISVDEQTIQLSELTSMLNNENRLAETLIES